MQLARIVFAGALLFGVGCVPSEEGELAIDQRIDETMTMEGRQVCTLDMARLTDEQIEELQDILNTAITDDELEFASLAPEQVARIQAILASAIGS